MTERLYYLDSYCTSFYADIISVREKNNKYEVILDRTYFYPTSGGQQSDRGKINNCSVIDVYEEKDLILHICLDKPDGNKAVCSLDWDRRFDFMQQHTGQHILSHSFLEILNAHTKSAHLGEEKDTIDIDIKELDWNNISVVENLANEIIIQAHTIRYHFFNNIEECKFKLRKKPVVECNIRIVEIENVDSTPCGGTHCRNTFEVGLIKVIGFEKYKGGYRIEFVCGKRAYTDYHNRLLLINSLRNELSSKSKDILLSVKRLKDSELDLKRKLSNLKKNYLRLHAELLIKDEKVRNDNELVCILEEYELDELKYLASVIVGKISKIVVLLGKQQNYIAIVIAKADDVSVDIEDRYKSVLNKYGWKGRVSENLLTGVFLSEQANCDSIFSEFK